jgi:hypothetical protein
MLGGEWVAPWYNATMPRTGQGEDSRYSVKPSGVHPGGVVPQLIRIKNMTKSKKTFLSEVHIGQENWIRDLAKPAVLEGTQMMHLQVAMDIANVSNHQQMNVWYHIVTLTNESLTKDIKQLLSEYPGTDVALVMWAMRLYRGSTAAVRRMLQSTKAKKEEHAPNIAIIRSQYRDVWRDLEDDEIITTLDEANGDVADAFCLLELRRLQGVIVPDTGGFDRLIAAKHTQMAGMVTVLRLRGNSSIAD